MIALFKKEIQNFFSSLIGYVVIAVFLLMTGLVTWVFPGNVLDSGYSSLSPLFSNGPLVFMFLIPAVTMRTFSEEKRTGTIELLYTFPISDLQIVLAKYFASVALILISLLPTITYYFSVYYLGNPVGNIDLTDLVSASTYPHIFLEYFVQDKIQKTVPSLDYWKVLFDPYPELAVEPNTLLVLNDTINQGEAINFQLSSQNIGTVDMDSVLVRISLQNERGFNSTSYKKYPPLEKGNRFTLSEAIETDELQGMYTLTAFINPDNDQNEQFLFNNIFSRDLLVIADNINPLLAVKFDGQRILNGDIVSTNPSILIELKDENPYLILNDTSLFEIRIKFQFD